jgi:hypothetical protein
MITGSIDVIIQASRLRDGSRKVTHVTEVVGMEGEVVTLQNLIVYEITGEDAHGKIVGRHRSTGIARPRFWERAEYYGETPRLAQALASAEVHDPRQPMGDARGLARSLLLGLLLLAAVSIGAVVYLLVNPYFSASGAPTSASRGDREPGRARLPARRRPMPPEAAASGRRDAEGLEDRQKAREKVSMRSAPGARRARDSPRAFWIGSSVCGVVVGAASGCRRRTCHHRALLGPSSARWACRAGFSPHHQTPPDQVHRRVRQRHRRDRARRQVGPAAAGMPWHHRPRVAAAVAASSPSSSSSSASACRWRGLRAHDDAHADAEVRFFAIVIAIQQQAGGNLSEALGNLSGVLRDRKRLQPRCAPCRRRPRRRRPFSARCRSSS